MAVQPKPLYDCKPARRNWSWQAHCQTAAPVHESIVVVSYFVPVSRRRLWSRLAGRKASSLQERIWVPTSSEPVAKIRAFSSFRFTPAMDATSLMSSSSLQTQMEEIQELYHAWNRYIMMYTYKTIYSNMLYYTKHF